MLLEAAFFACAKDAAHQRTAEHSGFVSAKIRVLHSEYLNKALFNDIKGARTVPIAPLR